MTRKEIMTKLHGVTMPEPFTQIPRQKIIKKYVRRNTVLRAVLEPDNPADPEAVAVYVSGKPGFLRKKRLYHIGYLSGPKGKIVHDMIVTGEQFYLVASEVTGGTRQKPTRGVNLRIVYQK